MHPWAEPINNSNGWRYEASIPIPSPKSRHDVGLVDSLDAPPNPARDFATLSATPAEARSWYTRHSDYAAMARALGAHGERVEDPSGLVDALRRALANAPAVVDVVTSQDAVSSDARKGLGFVPDYQALTAWDDAERRRRGEI